MKTQVLNMIGNDWSNEVTNAVEDVMNKLKDIPNMKKHIPYLDSVLVLRNPFDDGEKQYTLGSYTQSGVIRIYANKIKSIPQAIYVLLHEFAHHVAFQLAGLDNEYDSVAKNKAYWKEEVRADALAIMLMKKFFNSEGKLAYVIKEAKARLKYMYQKLLGKNPSWDTTYTYSINWSSSWNGWNSKSAWSNLALAA